MKGGIMKIFIFENLDHVSNEYHKGGGLAIIAEDQLHALALLLNTDAKVTEEEWEKAKIYPIEAQEPKVFIFPDNGCCG